MASTGAAPESLSFAAARARVLDAVSPGATERVPLAAARGRALARELTAPIALPPFRNSSMDGIVARAADLAGASAARPCTLQLVATVAAGHVAPAPLGAGEAMRIMTGAMRPEGGDAVVPVEELVFARDGAVETVRVGRPAEPGENVREAGADVAAGAVALAAGTELDAHALALVAALGVTTLEVGARARVAIVSTGDELVEPDQPLVPGAIRDTNRPMLAALAEDAGAVVVRSTHVGDDPAAVTAAIRDALAAADVVLTIGGVSEGDFDPVKQALGAIGDVALWRVAMKPGRPQAFGTPGGRLFFGLPGNPASVACVFDRLVRPALRRMQGFRALERPRLTVACACPVPSRAGRTDFVRARLAWRDGRWLAEPAGAQVSGHLSPQALAHGLLVVPAERDALATGEPAEFIVWRWPIGEDA